MGAKCYAVMEEKGVQPKQTHSLKTLRCLMSTGSPLKPTSFHFIYRHIKDDLLLASISGMEKNISFLYIFTLQLSGVSLIALGMGL